MKLSALVEDGGAQATVGPNKGATRGVVKGPSDRNIQLGSGEDDKDGKNSRRLRFAVRKAANRKK